MSFIVYILTCADGTLYTGYTTDIDRRLKEHNAGIAGAKYTKMRRPVVLSYCEMCDSKSTAMKRECAIKKYSREEKLALCRKG